jgi:hypothetical protein
MVALIPTALLLIGQATQTASKPPSPAVLQVGVFSYGPDGKPQAAAYETSLASESFQYIAGCEIGGGNRPVPDRATDAWRVSGNVERLNEEEAVVRVDWQRVRAAGTTATSPGGSIHLTLHPGDRVPLDSANPDPTVGCGGRTIGFEARFESRPGWMIVPGRGPLNESPAITVMRGGGAGIGAGSGSGMGATASNAGGGIRLPKTEVTERREFSADLWLVKTDAQNDKPEFNMQGLALQNVKGRTSFAFSPFTIDTPGGPIAVQIMGSMEMTTARGPSELVFTTQRTVRFGTGGPNRDAISTSSGSSTTRNPWPAADDVLSFELPPIRMPNSMATIPDQYSVRVRIR